jgi:hypothetical protein
MAKTETKDPKVVKTITLKINPLNTKLTAVIISNAVNP